MSTIEVQPYPVSHDLNRPAFSEGILAKQLRRVRLTANMMCNFGVLNTLQVIGTKVGRQGRDGEIDLELANKKGLRAPLHVSSRPSDLWIIDEVLNQSVYGPVKDFRRRIDGKPIVDLGAYTGITAAYFASLFPDSEVLAVEPHPRNFGHLAINAGRYGNVTAVHAAAAPDHAPVYMTVFGGSEENYTANRFSTMPGGTSPYEVGTITPAEILGRLGDPESIGLLKVDIEGAERELLASAADTLLSRTAVLAIETHDRFSSGSGSAIADAAKRNGFVLANSNEHTGFYVASSDS